MGIYWKASCGRLGSRERIKFHACVATAAVQVFDMSSKEGHPSFQGFVKASGQAELWDKGAGKLKSGDQLVGWCRKHTTDYSSDTLIGNWNEERFDVTKLAQSKCLPSQYSHYFETTYSQGYSRSPHKVPEVLKYSRGKIKYADYDINYLELCLSNFDSS